MKDLLTTTSKIYCDYTIFLNDSFELFCEEYAGLLKDNGITLNIPQPVIDEMKAVPMSRMDDYALCYQGLARIDNAVIIHGLEYYPEIAEYNISTNTKKLVPKDFIEFCGGIEIC